MAKKPYTNDTADIQHVGNVTLWPGETREVEETLIQGHQVKPPVKEAESDPIDHFLKGKSPDIIDAIKFRGEDGAPLLSDDEIDKMEAAESGAKKPRKGILNALAEEKLTRAAQKQENPGSDESGGEGAGSGDGNGNGEGTGTDVTGNDAGGGSGED